MSLYIVGLPFHDERYRGAKDSAVIEVMDTTLNIIIFIDSPTAKEVHDFTNGTITYGIFQEKNIPFITLEFPTMSFDAPLSIKNLESPVDKKQWLQSEDNLMGFILVESNSYLTSSIRLVSANTDFMKELRTILISQDQQYPDRKTADEMIDKVNNKYSHRQMMQRASKYRFRPG